MEATELQLLRQDFITKDLVEVIEKYPLISTVCALVFAILGFSNTFTFSLISIVQGVCMLALFASLLVAIKHRGLVEHAKALQCSLDNMVQSFQKTPVANA